MLVAEQPLSREADLRRLVRGHLAELHGGDPDTVVCDEFAVCRGQARIDLAVVNGTLSGYELKSAVDSLYRLPGQVGHYNCVFDSITVVVAPSHVKHVYDYLPDWYGIWIAEPGARSEIVKVRASGINPAQCPRSLAQLLWRDEMLFVLQERGLDSGMLRKPRRDLISALCDRVTVAELGTIVRDQIRRRQRYTASPV